ncbi:MAG: hypothetical protein ACI87E_001209 [Mariniblastus sp.]|jgi:hypothetical protein
MNLISEKQKLDQPSHYRFALAAVTSDSMTQICKSHAGPVKTLKQGLVDFPQKNKLDESNDIR